MVEWTSFRIPPLHIEKVYNTFALQSLLLFYIFWAPSLLGSIF